MIGKIEYRLAVMKRCVIDFKTRKECAIYRKIIERGGWTLGGGHSPIEYDFWEESFSCMTIGWEIWGETEVSTYSNIDFFEAIDCKIISFDDFCNFQKSLGVDVDGFINS